MKYCSILHGHVCVMFYQNVDQNNLTFLSLIARSTYHLAGFVIMWFIHLQHARTGRIQKLGQTPHIRGGSYIRLLLTIRKYFVSSQCICLQSSRRLSSNKIRRIFMVSDQVRHKRVCTTTEDGLRLDKGLYYLCSKKRC